ncbi:CD276 antigen-like [Pristis pectinata]|uniref:CD276 antigen-like n=1 Tax=Pristis pectinata TaxID=685728 RepID=UPI00223CB64A|nr:CD276 antigen-like [Pristis pectinata]
MNDWLLGLFLTVACAEAGQLTVVGLKGEPVTLPCVDKDGRPSSPNTLVSWQKGNEMVHVQNGRGRLREQQDAVYRNRTGMDAQGFSQGNFSLTFGPLRLADEGKYQCIVLEEPQRDKLHNAEVRLYVGASYSTPSIVGPPLGDTSPGDVVNLTCLSSGGYPQPVVNWTDGESRPLVNVSSEDEMGQDQGSKLWNVSSVIWVTVTPNSSFICTVRNPRTGEICRSSPWRGFRSQLPENLPRRSTLSYVTPVVIALTLLVALGLVYQRKTSWRTEMTVTCSEEHQMNPLMQGTVLPVQVPC